MVFANISPNVQTTLTALRHTYNNQSDIVKNFNIHDQSDDKNQYEAVMGLLDPSFGHGTSSGYQDNLWNETEQLQRNVSNYQKLVNMAHKLSIKIVDLNNKLIGKQGNWQWKNAEKFLYARYTKLSNHSWGYYTGSKDEVDDALMKATQNDLYVFEVDWIGNDVSFQKSGGSVSAATLRNEPIDSWCSYKDLAEYSGIRDKKGKDGVMNLTPKKDAFNLYFKQMDYDACLGVDQGTDVAQMYGWWTPEK